MHSQDVREIWSQELAVQNASKIAGVQQAIYVLCKHMGVRHLWRTWAMDPVASSRKLPMQCPSSCRNACMHGRLLQHAGLHASVMIGQHEVWAILDNHPGSQSHKHGISAWQHPAIAAVATQILHTYSCRSEQQLDTAQNTSPSAFQAVHLGPHGCRSMHASSWSPCKTALLPPMLSTEVLRAPQSPLPETASAGRPCQLRWPHCPRPHP